MAYEIEKYLLDKFTAETRPTERGSSKVAQYKDLGELRRLLRENLDSYSNQTPSGGQDFPENSRDRSTLIRDKLYYLNNILSEYRSKTKSNNFVTNYTTRRNLNKVKEQLIKERNADQNRKKEESPNDSNNNPPEGSSSSSQLHNGNVEHLHWSTPWVDRTKIYGLERELESLRKSLIEKELSSHPFKAIGIVGMGGIGKTTLSQYFYNDEKVMSHFAPRVWVCMWREPTEDEDTKVAIGKRMLVHLGVEEEMVDACHGRLDAVLSLLHQQLWGKRYLIIFDDARDDHSWYQNLDSFLTHGSSWKDSLGYGLPKGYGGTVIVTARNEEVAANMVGAENLRRMMPLQDKESCWRIFKDSAEEGGVKSLDLTNDEKEMREEIVQKCGGLPLAAKVMGQIVNDHIRQQLQGNNLHP